jgi:hypothetical protein
MKTDSVVRARTPTMTTTTGAHVTVGVQEPVSTFVITRTEAAVLTRVTAARIEQQRQ